jgi:hypothetical protein
LTELRIPKESGLVQHVTHHRGRPKLATTLATANHNISGGGGGGVGAGVPPAPAPAAAPTTIDYKR